MTRASTASSATCPWLHAALLAVHKRAKKSNPDINLDIHQLVISKQTNDGADTARHQFVGNGQGSTKHDFHFARRSTQTFLNKKRKIFNLEEKPIKSERWIVVVLYLWVVVPPINGRDVIWNMFRNHFTGPTDNSKPARNRIARSVWLSATGLQTRQLFQYEPRFITQSPRSRPARRRHSADYTHLTHLRRANNGPNSKNTLSPQSLLRLVPSRSKPDHQSRVQTTESRSYHMLGFRRRQVYRESITPLLLSPILPSCLPSGSSSLVPMTCHNFR